MDKFQENLSAKRDIIYLRKMEISDTEKIVNWRNKEWVRRNFIYQKPFTAEGHLNWIRTQIEMGHVVQFIICEKGSDRAVGSAYLRDIDRETGRAEFGIFIGEEDAVGKGYGNIVYSLMLIYAFEELGLKSVFMRAYEDNMASIRAGEKAGYRIIPGKWDEVDINGIKRKVVFLEVANGAFS